MKGTVESIFISPKSGENLNVVETAVFETGKGIVNDRYHKGTGTFSQKLEERGKDDFSVTLIEIEEIENFLKKTGFNYAPQMFRRNILTKGIRLNDLVGKEFTIGNTKLFGVRLCEPCQYLSRILGKEVLEHMMGKSGLRAGIIEGGTVNTGDAVG